MKTTFKIKFALWLFWWTILNLSSSSAFTGTSPSRFENSFLRWNNYIKVEEGLPNLQKTLLLPVELNVRSAYWDGDILKKVVLQADPQALFGISVFDSETLKQASNLFMAEYGHLFNIGDKVNLKIIHTDYPQKTSTPSSSFSSTSLILPMEHIATVIYEQVVTHPLNKQNYPVTGTFVVLGFNKNVKDGKVYLNLIKSNIYEESLTEQLREGDLLPEEEIKRSVKTQIVSDYKQDPPLLEEKSIKLVAYPVSSDPDGNRIIIWAYELVFKLSYSPQNHIERLKVIADAESGKILNIENSLKYNRITGEVTGSIYPEIPTRPIQEGVAFKDLTVKITEESGGEVVGQTDSLGIYALDVNKPRRLKAAMLGPWVGVVNAVNGKSVNLNRRTSGGYNINWKDYDSSYKNEQSNVFYHTHIMHDFVIRPSIQADMVFPITARVNIPDICNAYYDPDDHSLNFFKKGKTKDEEINISCEATSLFNDIIFHEATHAISEKLIQIYWPYWDQTGNINEGISDYTACSISDTLGVSDPACVNDFELGKGETCFRRCDSDDKYPDDYDPEPHSGMQIISGSLWHLREKLINKYGQEGAGLADALVFGALRFQPISFIDFLDSILLSDDDNGNILDGTRNIQEICDSFHPHGIYSAVCEGSINEPVADILGLARTPQIGVYHLVGSAYALEPFLKQWVLELGKRDPLTGLVEWKTLKQSDQPVKNYYLLQDWSYKDLEPGLYLLRLSVTDTLNRSASDQVEFQKPREITLNVYNDKTSKNIGEINLIVRSLSQQLGADTYSPKKINTWKKNIFLPAEDTDLIVFMTEKDKNPQQYLFYKRIPLSADHQELTLLTSATGKLSTNAEQIIANKGMQIDEVVHIISLGTKDFESAPVKINNLHLSYDNDLLYRDYSLVTSLGASRLSEDKFMKLSALYPFPFPASVTIDESSLKSHNMTLLDTIKFNKYSIAVSDYTSYFAEPLKKGHTYTAFIQPLPSLPSPTFGAFAWGKDTITIPLVLGPFAVALEITEFLFEKIDPSNNDQQAFRSPFRFVIDPWKNLDGYFVNGSDKNIYGLLSPPFNLKVTNPDGKASSIENPYFLENINWSLKCKDHPCPTGDYTVDWTSDNIFKNQKIIRFQGKYRYDGTQFTAVDENQAELDPFLSQLNHNEETTVEFIRGDANDDGSVNLSDIIDILGWLFRGGPPPQVLDAADVDDNGKNELTDAIYLIQSLFIDGRPIPAPYPNDGEDTTDDDLVTP